MPSKEKNMLLIKVATVPMSDVDGAGNGISPWEMEYPAATAAVRMAVNMKILAVVERHRRFFMCRNILTSKSAAVTKTIDSLLDRDVCVRRLVLMRLKRYNTPVATQKGKPEQWPDPLVPMKPAPHP